MNPISSSTVIQPLFTVASQANRHPSTDVLRRASQGSRAIGAAYFSLFGSVWLLFAYHLAHWRGLLPLAVVLAVGLSLFLAAIGVASKRRDAMRAVRRTPERRRTLRWFRAIHAAEWIATVAAVFLLAEVDLSVWIAPAVMLIVGLHLLPLARIFRYRPHLVTGAILIVAGLLYPFVSSEGPGSPSGCLVAGATLWLSALWSLRASAT